MHYVSLLNSGFSLDYNDFTLLEQKYISYGLNLMRNQNKKKSDEWWAKFFNKGFNSIGKGLNSIGKMLAKRG